MSVREWEVSPPSTHCHPHLPALGTRWYRPETRRGGSTLLSPPCMLPQPCLDNLSFPPPSPPSPSTAGSGRLTGAFSPLLEVPSSPSDPHSPTSLSNLPRDLWSLSVPSFFSAWTDYQGPFVCSSATTAQELQDPQVNAPATLEPHCFSPASFCP